jgi:hypothetical protein
MRACNAEVMLVAAAVRDDGHQPAADRHRARRLAGHGQHELRDAPLCRPLVVDEPVHLPIPVPPAIEFVDRSLGPRATSGL